MEPIKVLLVDDHKIVREGTRQIITQEDQLTVIGEAANGADAVQLAGELRPDVIVMDVRMPDMNGIEATKAIKARYPRTKILILSAHKEDHYIFPLLDAGATGYLLKTVGGERLVQAICAIHSGETVLDPEVAGKVFNRLKHKQAYFSADLREGLTQREMEVLQAVARGKTNKEVGERLCISPHTVQVHLRNIFAKLGVKNRIEAVAYAREQDWL
jgi:DNA-binding NarL/FixJ family response regulator